MLQGIVVTGRQLCLLKPAFSKVIKSNIQDDYNYLTYLISDIWGENLAYAEIKGLELIMKKLYANLWTVKSIGGKSILISF